MSTSSRPPAAREPRVSVSLTDASGRPLVTRQAARTYYAASTMKLAVLLAATKAVADGALTLDHELVVSRAFTGADGSPFELTGDHLDPVLPPPGAPMTLAGMLEAMIVRSSNETTNSVIELVGLPAVAAAATACGCRRTRVERLIGDPSAVTTGLTNEVTTGDLVTLLRAVVTGRVPGWAGPLPDDLVTLHIDWLERQTIAPIGAVVPPGVRWGSKSGEIDGIRHDVAFIGDPRTDDVRYVAVCTQGLGETAANEVIAALTETLVLPQVG